MRRGLIRVGAAAARRAHSTQATQIFGGTDASESCRRTFDAWHAAAKVTLASAGDASYDESAAEALRLVEPHFHERCVFRPPTYYKPWEGRAETLLLLGQVSQVFGPSFRYGRQWLSDDGREWALEFTAEIGASGRAIQGIDLVSLDADGLITDFTVLARPHSAKQMLGLA